MGHCLCDDVLVLPCHRRYANLATSRAVAALLPIMPTQLAPVSNALPGRRRPCGGLEARWSRQAAELTD